MSGTGGGVERPVGVQVALFPRASTTWRVQAIAGYPERVVLWPSGTGDADIALYLDAPAIAGMQSAQLSALSVLEQAASAA